MPLPIPSRQPPRQPPRRPPRRPAPVRNSMLSRRLNWSGRQKPTTSIRSSGRPRWISRSGWRLAPWFLAPAPMYPCLTRRERTRKASTASRLCIKGHHERLLVETPEDNRVTGYGTLTLTLRYPLACCPAGLLRINLLGLRQVTRRTWPQEQTVELSPH